MRTPFFLIALTMSAVAAACNIPVFRYALERWQPDSCEVIVFHDAALSDADEKFVKSLEATSIVQDGPANLRIIRADIRTELSDDIASLWQTLTGREAQTAAVTFPYVVARSKLAKGRVANHWQGTLEDARTGHLLESPVRTELTRRLLAGDSVVWLLLKSTDAEQSKAAKELLESQFRDLSRRIELPEGIGLPGSELHSDVPLLLQFSVLEIAADDPKEQFLVRLLKGFQPDAFAAGTPLAIPVFGRGRALEVIPASQLNPGLIEDLTVFLCGACSCQVKELNPGFDLLLGTDWNLSLFGEDGQPPAPSPPQNRFSGDRARSQQSDTKLDETDQHKPKLVPIPSGKRKENP